MKQFLSLSLVLVLALGSCKKDKSGGNSTTALQDSSLLIARDYYLWYDQIPTNFNAGQFGNPDEVMNGIRAYSIEPDFSEPVDRWSFGMLKTEWDAVSGGISGDIGLVIFFRSSNDLRVCYVEPESVAGKAGVERSWQITKINGSTDINSGSSSSINAIVAAIYGSAPVSVSFLKPDGSTIDLSLSPGAYQERPLALDTVYEAAGKKIGYMVLNSFLGNIDNMKASFSNSFQQFSTAGVTDMIVDLRYNGGGYVSLQEELANYLVPSGKNGTLMYKETFNDKLSNYNESVNFSKKGNLSPVNIVFILSQNTASASEALINIMRPQLNVKLVGPSPSTGKPVGFFNIPVGDWYVFPVSLRLVNANNEGNYFDGLSPDKVVADGLDKPWGDLSENCLATAYSYLATGTFRSGARESGITVENLRSYNSLSTQKPKFMVETRIPGR